MFKNKFAFILLALLISFQMAPQASAGIYIEPYLGYNFGKWEGGAGAGGSFAGPAYGARLGYSILGIAFGAEYEAGSFVDDSSPKVDVTPVNLGVFASFTFPILIRVYAGYALKSEMEINNGAGLKDTFTGKVMKAGVGFTGLPFVVINLEYQAGDYTESSNNTQNGTAETKTYGLNVSLPLDF